MERKSCLEQRQYLEAMGIQLWQARVPAALAIPEAAPEPADAAAPPPSVEVAVSPEFDPPPQQQAEAYVPAPAREPVSEQAPAAPVSPPTNVPVPLDWDALQARVVNCVACELSQGRTQTVFGVGNRQADWMVIGEAPGADEDRQGEPFVGKAGQLLNQMLMAVGLARQQVYIANIVKCRPPNNRDPRPEEAAACEAYLKAQISMIRPKVILAVGRVAAQNLLKTDQRVGAMRGKKLIYEQEDISVPVVVTYHPAYLLRSPQEKRKSWQDLLLARSVLKGSQP